MIQGHVELMYHSIILVTLNACGSQVVSFIEAEYHNGLAGQLPSASTRHMLLLQFM